MKMSFLKWWLLLLWLIGIEGLKRMWEPDESLINHRMMKMILESCYENQHQNQPIVVFGNFRESIEVSSVIKLDPIRGYKDVLANKSSDAASKVILIAHSPEEVHSDLHFLQRTRWWNHMALFFIIEANAKTCANALDMLTKAWNKDILNSIYICTESNNTSALYTYNPITNYAPSPWKRVETREHFYLFRRIIDSNIPCENLHYDKTKKLHGYEVTVGEEFIGPVMHRQRFYFGERNVKITDCLLLFILDIIFKSWKLNAHVDSFDRDAWKEGGYKSDLLLYVTVKPRDSKLSVPSYIAYEVRALVPLQQEVSLLSEIRQLWNSSVLIVAVTTLAIILIILLDLKKLLTYIFIPTDRRIPQFRIYLTTIFIFIGIITIVFHGFIVTFLAKPQRMNYPETFDEFQELGYKVMVEPDEELDVAKLCPNCNLQAVNPRECRSYAANYSNHVCISASVGHELSKEFALNYSNKVLYSKSVSFLHRQNWPLRERFKEILLRFFESGLTNYWIGTFEECGTTKPDKRKAESSVPQYKPLNLNDLSFAFQVLGLGLSISTIVFFMESIVARDWKTVVAEYLSEFFH